MGAFGTSGLAIYHLFSWIFGASIAGSIYSFGYTLLIGVIFNLIMGVVFSKWMLKSLSQIKFLRKPWLYGGKKNA
jgi:ABC-type antimicrobial peptide transport system permease subunit